MVLNLVFVLVKILKYVLKRKRKLFLFYLAQYKQALII